MNKIISIVKKNYKILIPVMAVIVLGVASIFLYKEFKYDNYRNKLDIDVYQYFGGFKDEYTAVVTYNLKDAIVDISAKNKKVEYDATPIYYSNEEKIIFPKEMTIVFPLREGSQYKLYKYATYYKEDNFIYIKNNTDTSQYSFFFLYDGNGVFFFPYDVMLVIDKKEIKLSEGSYVNLVGDTLVYYNYGEKKGKLVELNGQNALIKSENINVNLKEKYVLSFGREVLLFGPNNLNPVFKTIDK